MRNTRLRSLSLRSRRDTSILHQAATAARAAANVVSHANENDLDRSTKNVPATPAEIAISTLTRLNKAVSSFRFSYRMARYLLHTARTPPTSRRQLGW